MTDTAELRRLLAGAESEQAANAARKKASPRWYTPITNAHREYQRALLEAAPALLDELEQLRLAIQQADDYLTKGSQFEFGRSDPIAAHLVLEAALRGVYPAPATPPADRGLADLCTCGHRRDHHINRDVDDVVGWPCLDCRSARCRGFALTADPRAEGGQG